LLDNKYTRAGGIVPTNWVGYGPATNHFQMGGGLNLRGYAGYYALEEYTKTASDSLFNGYYSNTGTSWNLEIDFDRFVKIKPKGITKNLKLDTYLFSDMGILVFQKPNQEYIPGKFRMDAGIGSALTIKFSPYQINPLVIRFDMPLLLNTPPYGEDHFQFRYVIGINRCF
jgi:aminopeptidase N